MNSDQFVCDIPLKSAIQIYESNINNSYYERMSIDNDVIEYLEKEMEKQNE